MNSKVFRAQEVCFSTTCKEVLEGKDVLVLYAEGVREYSYKEMIVDFERQQQMRPNRERACFYCVLRFQNCDGPSDETLVEIAEKFLIRIGVSDTQYVIIKQTDGEDLCLHLIANMVSFLGTSIKDSFIWIKAEKAARQLTKEYNLSSW